MGLRRQSRELALKTLYLIDVSGITTDEALQIITKYNKFNPKLIEFAELLVNETIKEQNKIDSLIEKYAENWELSRMATVDRNILRIGACEMLKTPQTPINVIIDEAVEIAKKFSTADSSKFVNGILDKIKEVRVGVQGITSASLPTGASR
jgi:N utilization substance protein B